MFELSKLSTQQLKRAVVIKEQIEALENELNQIFGGASPSKTVAPVSGDAEVPQKRKVSAAARAKMRLAQQARWAKIRGTAAPAPAAAAPAAAPAPKPKRKMSAAQRAKLSAAATARWANVKAQGRATL